MTKVTVLMAVCNGELYLREAIDSILNQTFDNFEFLIINDGSTDRTKEIICSYDDSRIRLIDNTKNLGLACSLNKGLKLAKGQFIARQDADDVSEPKRLTKQIAFLEKNPEIALIGSWYTKIDRDGEIIGRRQLPCDCTQIRWDLFFYCPFVHSSVVFRKDIIQEKIGFYSEKYFYSQDYDFWHRISQTFMSSNVNDYLVRLRSHPKSMTASYGVQVELEPANIRLLNIAKLLKTFDDKALDKTFLLKIDSLFFGIPIFLNVEEFDAAAHNFFYLFYAFTLSFNSSRIEFFKFYLKFLKRMTSNLVKLYCYYFFRNSKISQRIIFYASLLHWSILKKIMYL